MFKIQDLSFVVTLANLNSKVIGGRDYDYKIKGETPAIGIDKKTGEEVPGTLTSKERNSVDRYKYQLKFKPD